MVFKKGHKINLGRKNGLGNKSKLGQQESEETKKKDKFRKKNKEVWHYTCECGQKWKSYSSPRGTYVYGEDGQTKCPKCKSPICKGEVYINGKYANMGACHMRFKK